MHSLSGSRMLGSTNEYTRLVPGVLHHHERWDGHGYPNGIMGDSISIESRIICIADAYDAMTCSRPYRVKPLTKQQAIDEIVKNSGKQFDPNIVKVFVSKVIDNI